MTDEQRLRHLVVRAQRYLRHHPGCRAGQSWPWSEACTCGVKDVYDRIQMVKLELRGNRISTMSR